MPKAGAIDHGFSKRYCSNRRNCRDIAVELAVFEASFNNLRLELEFRLRWADFDNKRGG